MPTAQKTSRPADYDTIIGTTGWSSCVWQNRARLRNTHVRSGASSTLRHGHGYRTTAPHIRPRDEGRSFRPHVRGSITQPKAGEGHKRGEPGGHPDSYSSQTSGALRWPCRGGLGGRVCCGDREHVCTSRRQGRPASSWAARKAENVRLRARALMYGCLYVYDEVFKARRDA
jgi:hypothetical protein